MGRLVMVMVMVMIGVMRVVVMVMCTVDWYSLYQLLRRYNLFQINSMYITLCKRFLTRWALSVTHLDGCLNAAFTKHVEAFRHHSVLLTVVANRASEQRLSKTTVNHVPEST